MNLQEMRKIAEAATQGEWTYYYEGSGDFVITTKRGEMATISGPDSRFMGGLKTEADATHIATFCPKKILKLLGLIQKQYVALNFFVQERDAMVLEGKYSELTAAKNMAIPVLAEYEQFNKGK